MNGKWIISFLVVLFAAGFGGAVSWADTGDVYVVTLSGSVNPGTSDFVKRSIKTAVDEGAVCLVIELDTPGGLAESMREIVQEILAADIPVVVFVSPGGARAASAGVMITMSADIAAMAHGTNIGAAHPVGAGGDNIDETMSEKVVNDMVAHARSVAEKRGRNAQWVEKAIRESVSVTETEAVKENVIDLVADDLPDLLRQINGREIPGKGKLVFDPDKVNRIEEGLRTKVLRLISDPNIAYILMMIGLAGLYFELAHPGVILPGVVGAVCLVLSFFAFQTLPVNYAGILLVLLALVFFILEIKVTSFGMLTVAGVVSMLLGSMMLFEDAGSGLQLSLRVLLSTVGIVSAFFIVIATLVVKAHTRKPRTGVEGIVGEVGVVKKPLTPEGKVFVHGELWHAAAEESIDTGTRVKIVGVRGMILDVEPVEAEAGGRRSEV